MKKIYPIEWVKYHPYKNANSIDSYYCSLVNKVIKLMYDCDVLHGDMITEESAYEEAAIFVVAWFEDIISKTGIWQVFTSQCEKRYGSRLPFYELDENYYPDEINVEDVRFLLWHCFQRKKLDEKIYNPENGGLEHLAVEIYSILDNEYETAPENDRLQEFFDFSNLKDGAYIEYRNKIEWFCFNSYINMGCYELYLEAVSEKMDELEEDEELSEMNKDIFLYSHRINTILNMRTPLLSITAPEYLKLLQETKQVDNKAPYINIDICEDAFYLVDDEKDDYFVFKYFVDNKERYNVSKSSIELSKTTLIPGETLVSSILFKYGKYWYHNGVMINYSMKDDGMKEKLAEVKKEFLKENQKKTYKDFLSATKGKYFVFCKDIDEMRGFIKKKMKYKNTEVIDIPDLDNDVIMLSATPERGLSIMRNYCDCVASPDNPYYNKERAEKYAINFITNPSTASYEYSCLLLDLGYLKDAGINSTKGDEYGREFVRKNAQFILDYFFKRNRETDFSLI